MARLTKKKPRAAMDDDTYNGVVDKLAQDAAFHVDHDLADDRIRATLAYRAGPMGNEEEGRCRHVMSVVRDTVNQVLPSILRVFAGSETAVEFGATNESEVQMAADATDAINHIFYNSNHGYNLVLEPAFQDSLIKKSGVLTWWFEEKKTPRELIYNNLTDEEMDMILAQDESMSIVSKIPSDEDDEDDLATSDQSNPSVPQLDPAVVGAVKTAVHDAFPAAQDIQIHVIEKRFDFRVRRITVDPLVRVAAIPPEQFLINRSATHEGDAICIGRRQVVRVSDLVALGFDYDEILENMGSSPVYSISPTNMEAEVRDPALRWGRQDAMGDDALREVLYSELYCRIDRDGDGIAELHRVQTIGEHNYVLHSEVYEDDEPPFAILCPYPEPHRAIGVSLADRLIDIQEMYTNVWRNTADSFAASIHPRTAIVEGQVNIDDVMNTEVGAIIRMRQIGAVQEFAHSFNSQGALGMLQQLDAIKAERTGVSAASQGLDPDVLQSSTASAVAATTSAADQTSEMICRRFAEGGMKRMFQGMLRILCRHFDEPLDVVRRDGSMTNIDPRNINPNLLCTANVGLGKGNDQNRLQALNQLLQIQTQIMQAAGITPMVGPAEIRNTVASMLQIAGIKDVSKYIKPVPPGWAPPNPANQPNPQMIVAQGQVHDLQQKNQIAAANATLAHEREMLKIQNQFQLEREKMADHRVLTLAQLQAQYGSQLQQAQMDQEIATEKAHIDLYGNLASQHMDLSHAADQAHLDRVADLEGQGLQHTADHAESTFSPPPPPPGANPGDPTQ